MICNRFWLKWFHVYYQSMVVRISAYVVEGQRSIPRRGVNSWLWVFLLLFRITWFILDVSNIKILNLLYNTNLKFHKCIAFLIHRNVLKLPHTLQICNYKAEVNCVNINTLYYSICLRTMLHFYSYKELCKSSLV